MPPKRGRGDGSPAKAPKQTSAKRTHRDDSQSSRSDSVATPTSNVGSSTEHNDPPHLFSEDVDPSLVVDYNESTPLPSPHSSDEHSELMRSTSPSAPMREAGELEEASLLPGSEIPASSTVPSGAATSTEHSAHGTTTASATPIIHNGESDADEVELIAPPTKQPASLARRREGGYVSGGLPPMPVPSAWMHSDGSSASLLQRATIDAHTLYSVFPSWKQQGRLRGRIPPIPVVLRPNETADEYEAEFLRRITPHEDAMKQRSQRINFAMKRAKELLGGKIPQVASRYASPAGPPGPSRRPAAGASANTQTPAQARRRATRQPVPKSRNSSGILSIGQGFEASASPSGGQATFRQGSVGSHPHPQAQGAPDRSGDYAQLFAAAYPAVVQTQTQSAALERRVSDLESQVSRLTSDLHSVRAKDRQGYDRLKLRLDLLERLVMSNPRQPRSPPRSPSPLRHGTYDSCSPSPSPPSERRSTHRHSRRRNRTP